MAPTPSSLGSPLFSIHLLPQEARLDLALQYVAVNLDLRHQDVFNLLRHTSRIFTGDFQSYHHTLYDLRKVLFECLKSEVQLEFRKLREVESSHEHTHRQVLRAEVSYRSAQASVEVTHTQSFHVTSEPSRKFTSLLYFVYRGTLVSMDIVPETVNQSFLQELTHLLVEVRRNQHDTDIIKYEQSRFPALILFDCCRRGCVLSDQGKIMNRIGFWQ